MQTAIAATLKQMSDTAARAAPARLHAVESPLAPCANCSLQPTCLSGDLDRGEFGRLQKLVRSRVRVRRGEALYRAGDAFRRLNSVRVGSFKTFAVGDDGQAQVTGFPMPGDLVGFDGIDTGKHASTLVALEDSEVCAFEFGDLQQASCASPALQLRLLRIMSREMADDRRMMVLLGTMRAAQRLAIFLTNQSTRYQRLGYSATEFVLRMTREDIGSYLGLTLETVSRLLSRFQQAGLIGVRQRAIKLLDSPALRQLAFARD